MKFINAISRFFHGPNLGLLIIRLMIGAVGIYHGSQKFFGAFGGDGFQGFVKFLESKDIPAPTVSAALAASAEFVGGILIALGLFTRFSAFAFAFTMAIAIYSTHLGDYKKMEFPLLIGVVCLGLVFTGPGTWSLQSFADKLSSGNEPKKKD
jgi:putative oxidoreductase